jgi:integrase
MGVRVREKDGSFWIFINHKRKRKAKKIGEKKVAEEVARRLRARLTLGLEPLNGSESPTVREYATQWLKTYVAVYTKPRTAEWYEGMLRGHILPALGRIQLGELSRRDVQAFVANRAELGLARNTLKGIVATLKALCNAAIEQSVITHNPAARLGRFASASTEKEARAIDAYKREELRVILETADRQYTDEADFIATTAWTGMRPGEAFGIQYPDIDVQGRAIEVRRTIDRRKKGVQITSPKSSRRRRVAIPEALADRLAHRRDRAAAEAALNGHAPPLWVFPNRAGKPKDAGNFAKRTWYPLLDKAGLRRLPPKALRHTYASLLIQQGVSLAFIKAQLEIGRAHV